MFSKEVIVSWLFGLLRVVTASISAILIEKGIATQGEWELLLTGLAGFIGTILWMYKDKIRIHVETLTGLASAKGTSLNEMREKIKEGQHASVNTPSDATPKLMKEKEDTK